MKVKKLKEFVQKHGVPCVFPCEKVDLIRAIWVYRCKILGEEIEGVDPFDKFNQRNKDFDKPDTRPEWATYRHLMSLPIEVQGNCPSQILPHLFLGGFDAARKSVTNKHKIMNVINLCCGKTETIEEQGRVYMKIAADDSPDYDLSPYFDSTFEFIDNAIENNRNVLVHCMAGVSRSTTIVIAYLIRKHPGLTLTQADQFVFRRRPFTNPNSGFITQLQAYEQRLIEERASR